MIKKIITITSIVTILAGLVLFLNCAWFYLDDGTGQIYIDLGPGNFVIPQYVGRTVRVMGKVVQEENRIIINAQGLEF